MGSIHIVGIVTTNCGPIESTAERGTIGFDHSVPPFVPLPARFHRLANMGERYRLGVPDARNFASSGAPAIAAGRK
jgi:hypothetical protein